MMKKLDKFLNQLYLYSGYLSALFLIVIGILIILSILTRNFNFYIAGLNEYSGYCLGTASFLGLAYTFKEGGHIRITLFLEKLSGTRKMALEIWCLLAASLFSGFLCFYISKMTYLSYIFEEKSEGADGIVLWPPQFALAFGSILLFICIVHQFIKSLKEYE
jgi:TRAP-type C4-dicarboxylate transport system permease small subunit